MTTVTVSEDQVSVQVSEGASQSSVTAVANDLTTHEALTTTAHGGIEPALGNPGTSGHVLSSTTGGVRSWIAAGALAVANTWSALQTFSAGIVAAWIAPAADSTTAFQIRKADRSTAVVTVDTTNARLGINRTPGSYELDVNGKTRLRGLTTVDDRLTVLGAVAISNNVAYGIDDTGGTLRDLLKIDLSNRISVGAVDSGWGSLFSIFAPVNIEIVVNNSTTPKIISIFGTSGAFFGGSTTPTACVDIAASTTSAASLRIRSGVAPTTPNAGDMWFDGTSLKFYDGTTTRTITWS